MKEKFFKGLKNYGGVLIALVLLMVVFFFVSPYFIQINNLLSILNQVSIIAIMAFGMTFVLMIGEIDLSVGSIAALTGVVLAMSLQSGKPLVVALLLTVIAGLFIGFTNGVISSKLKIPTFIVTVATMGIFRGIGYAITKAVPITITSETLLYIGNGKAFGVIPVPVLIMITLLVVGHVLLMKTRFGRKSRLIGGNRSAAEYVGIDTNKIQIKIFMISGFMSAIASIILSARLYSAQPNVAEGYELDAIASAVLGGTSLSGGYGSVIGTFIGALIIGVINNGMNLVGLEYFYQQIIKGIIIILAVYVDKKNKSK